MRRRALELVGTSRTLDDLTDLELFARQTDDAWYIDLCIEQLHRLPSEIDPILGCREYTTLQARAIVQQARGEMMRMFAGGNNPKMPDA